MRKAAFLWIFVFLAIESAVALHHHGHEMADRHDCPVYILSGGIADLPQAIANYPIFTTTAICALNNGVFAPIKDEIAFYDSRAPPFARV